MTAEPLPRSADPGTVDADNPWPGLASFREADRELFFGRELETRELLRLALRERLTVLFGLSGLGKTSLLRAGLFPLLRQENVLPVYLRLDFAEQRAGTLAGQVRQAILREAEAAGIEAPAFPESETLWESLHRQGAELWSPRNRIVTPLLVFDQFEEIFTLGRGSAARARETEAFLTELADLCEGSVPAAVRERLEADPAAARDYSFTRHPYKILLSLREDFLPDLEGLRGRIRSIVNNRFRLRRMNGDNALRVVTQAGGRLVEPDVPEKVVRFVAGREGDGELPLAGLEIEPALLSVVCRELNNKRRAQGLPRITAGLVQGNRDEILSDLYERSVGDLGPEVRSFVEERLLTKSGFRDTVALENAVELPGVTREALDKLTDRRLLRIEDRGGQQRLELTHDVLTGVIRKSRDLRRGREAERKLRRSRAVIGLLTLVLLGVVAFALWGFAAQRRAREALVSTDIARAWLLQDGTPAHALAYLARAIRAEPENVEAQSLLTDLLLDRTWLRPVRVFQAAGQTVIHLSADGRRFVTSAAKGTLQVRDTGTFRPIGRPIPAPRGADVIELGGEWLLTRFFKDGINFLRLWNIHTGQEARQLEEGTARLSPDGRWLVWIPAEGELSLLEIATGESLGIGLPPYDAGVQFTPDGRKLLAHTNARIVVLDLSTRRQVVETFDQGFSDAVLFPDGRRVLIKDIDPRVWDTVSGQISRNPLPPGELYDAAMVVPSPDGERVLIVPESRDEVRVWNPFLSLNPLSTIAAGVAFSDLELSADGQLALATAPDQIVLLSVYGGERLAKVLCDCRSARFLPGSRQIAIADAGGTLSVWSFAAARTGTELFPPSGREARFSEDGRRLSRIPSFDGRDVQVLDTASGKAAGPLVPIPDEAMEAALTSNGRFLVTVGTSESRVWDVEAGKVAWPPKPSPKGFPSRAPTELLPSPDGRLLALWKRGRPAIDLWNLETGKPAASLALASIAAGLQFSPDGSRIATLSDGSVRLWQLPEGKPLEAAIQPSKPVTSFCFSEDGRQIATAAEDGSAWIWDASSGERLAGPLQHPDIVQLRFEQDGQRLLAWSSRFTQIWDARTGQQVSPRIPFRTGIQTANLSPDGIRLMIQGQDSSIGLYDTRGRPIRSPIRMTTWGGIQYDDARFSPDGQRVWSVPNDQVHVLAVPTFRAREGDLLARWAEAVGGYTLDEQGLLTAVPNQIQDLETLRRETASAQAEPLSAASLIRWFLSDPGKRGISPVIPRTQEEVLRFFLEPRTSYDWDHAASIFPGHPLFRKYPRPPTPEERP